METETKNEKGKRKRSMKGNRTGNGNGNGMRGTEQRNCSIVSKMKKRKVGLWKGRASAGVHGVGGGTSITFLWHRGAQHVHKVSQRAQHIIQLLEESE
jgi:hypothetical protein